MPDEVKLTEAEQNLLNAVKRMIEEKDTGDADRVVYGTSRKVSDGNYGSTEVHFSYSTDVKIGESLEQATVRCVTYVDTVLSKKLNEKK